MISNYSPKNFPTALIADQDIFTPMPSGKKTNYGFPQVKEEEIVNEPII